MPPILARRARTKPVAVDGALELRRFTDGLHRSGSPRLAILALADSPATCLSPEEGDEKGLAEIATGLLCSVQCDRRRRTTFLHH